MRRHHEVNLYLQQGNLEGIGHFPRLLLAEEGQHQQAQSSLLYKRLFSYLSSWESSSLVEDVIFASSTGPNYPIMQLFGDTYTLLSQSSTF